MTPSRKKVQIDMVSFRRDVEAGDSQIMLCKKNTASQAILQGRINEPVAPAVLNLSPIAHRGELNAETEA
jgi:hypothetical protein